MKKPIHQSIALLLLLIAVAYLSFYFTAVAQTKPEPAKAIQLTPDEQKGILDIQNQINLLDAQRSALQAQQQVLMYKAADAHGIRLSEYEFGAVNGVLGFSPKAKEKAQP